MPGVLSEYDGLDGGRAALNLRFEEMFGEAGYESPDLGRRRQETLVFHRAYGGALRAEGASSLAYDTMLERGRIAVDTKAHRAEWEAVDRQVRDRLAGRIYPKRLLDSMIAAVGKPE